MKAQDVVKMQAALREAKRFLHKRVFVDLDLTEKQARDIFYYCRKSRALGRSKAIQASFDVYKGKFCVRFSQDPDDTRDIKLEHIKNDKGVVKPIVTVARIRRYLRERKPAQLRYIDDTRLNDVAWEQVLMLKVGEFAILEAEHFDFNILGAKFFFPEVKGRVYEYEPCKGFKENDHLVIRRLSGAKN